MPFYTYECPNCGRLNEDFRTVARRNDPYLCACGTSSACHAYWLSRAIVRGTNLGFRPYYDVGCGRYFETRADRDREWKKLGYVGLNVRDVEDSMNRMMRPQEEKMVEVEKTFDTAWNQALQKARKAVYERKRITLR